MTTRFFIGTSGWHYDHWRGIFYPEKLPKSRWLELYAQHFSTVELNNSFYRLPTGKAFQAWRDGSPPGFRFAVKASRFITHIKRLRDVEEPLETFVSRARHLGDKLGPILYQLPPSMKRNEEVLEAFLALLPKNLQHVLEFRNRTWYHDGVLALMRRYSVAFCIHDMARLETPVVAAADFAYLRFHGPTGAYAGCYTDLQLEDWASRIRQLSIGLKATYAYFNNDIGGYAVENASQLRRMLEGE